MRDKHKFNEWHKERRQKLKEAGLCTSCGKVPPRQDKVTCEKCGAKQTAAVKKWNSKQQPKYKTEKLCSCGSQPIEGRKICEECNKRHLANYYRRKEKGLCSYCSNLAITGFTRCQSCIDRLKEQAKQLRTEVFAAYGGSKCNCCGETIDRFLTLDHINNDGKEHRKLVGRTSVLRWLKENNYPEGYQVLCFNCNMGRQLNGGICPHKQI